MLGINVMINKKQSSGFSLVELMVAMVIGLIVMGGAFSMHQTSRETQKITETQMDLVADARFATELIAYDLRHAGAWGSTNKASLIKCKSTDTGCAAPPTAVADDCAVAGDPAWAYNLELPIFAVDSSDGNVYSGTCIPAGENYVAGTDILELRYADANNPVLRAGQAYVRSNFLNGQVFVGTAEPTLDFYNTSPLTKNHELHSYTYYISDFTDVEGDGIPSLRRVALVNGPATQNQMLVSGVTNLQVQLGVDVNDDQVIDRYVNPNDVAADEWEHVLAAKIWLIMRSDEEMKDVDTTRSFSIAGAAEQDFGGVDDFRYFMVSSVVKLRNLKQQ